MLSKKQKGDKLQKDTLFTWYGRSTVTDCVHALTSSALQALHTLNGDLADIYRPRSRGDNTFGSVRPSIRLSILLVLMYDMCQLL